MKIGIIGASLAGLVAGDKLAKAGHDATIIEKEQAVGGRLATYHVNGGFFDYGVPFLSSQTDEFSAFIHHLEGQNLLHKWASEVEYYDGSKPHKLNRNINEGHYFSSFKGLHSIAEHLKRWVDIKSAEQAGGLTHIGANRGRKRAWMINLSDISVFECDAVILAVPAPQAYGILGTAQDETAALRIIRVLDDISYDPRYVLMASYEHEMPEWKAIECNHSSMSWLCSESSKSENPQHTHIAIHSSGEFARKYASSGEQQVKELLLEDAASALHSSWLSNPRNTYLHHWKYYEAMETVDDYFMELEMEEAPLALIGDYFSGNSIEAAYVSAVKLADYWIDKYAETVKQYKV